MADPIPFTRKQRLGAGAGGEVWLASGEAGDVALKLAGGGRSLSAEIGALARIRHPSVPGLLAADREGTWFARAYVAGARLTSWAHGRPIDERCRTLRRLAEAVQAIHDAGVLHGDLSPANVLVDDEGAPYVLDIGADNRGGALGWMAPERFRGDPPTLAADVYGLGALLYALLTGRPPHERIGSAALGYSAAASLPLPPSSHVPDLPTDLEDLALACLTWSPAGRPRRASAVADALAQAEAAIRRRPVLGMLDERDRLRRAVVDALRGEPGFVLVHGPKGSGRATLIAEMARAARREGLRVREVPLATARQALVLAGETEAVFIDADGASTAALVDAVEPRTEAALVVVRASGPARALARRGATHVRPIALERPEIQALGQTMGLPADTIRAAAERSAGRPGVLLALLGGHLPPGPRPDARQGRLLDRLEAGAATLPELAELVDLPETATLDLLEPLMDRGMVWASPEGDRLFGSRAAP